MPGRRSLVAILHRDGGQQSEDVPHQPAQARAPGAIEASLGLRIIKEAADSRLCVESDLRLAETLRELDPALPPADGFLPPRGTQADKREVGVRPGDLPARWQHFEQRHCLAGVALS